MGKRYTTAQLTRWVLSHAKVSHHTNEEIQFPCPKCGHKAHYFNVRKGIGFCHHAGCKQVTTVKLLEKAWGSSPKAAIIGYTPNESPHSEDQASLNLPGGAKLLLSKQDGKLLSRFPEVVARIQESRFVTPSEMFRWSFHIDTESERIIVPVYSGGVLRCYISRAIWWQPSKTDYKRYKYPSGRSIKEWIFGWDEARRWSELTLVENTFNAIWLRDKLHCTTAFGSDLSASQIKQLEGSKVKRLTFLWDRGAEGRATNLVKKIGRMTCKVITLTDDKPQPDDWTAEELEEMVKQAW